MSVQNGWGRGVGDDMSSEGRPLPESKKCVCGRVTIITCAGRGALVERRVECSDYACDAKGPWRKTKRGAINTWNRLRGGT
jgi:hypothetical protein